MFGKPVTDNVSSDAQNSSADTLYIPKISIQDILRLCWPVNRSLEDHCSVGWSVRADMGSFQLLIKSGSEMSSAAKDP